MLRKCCSLASVVGSSAVLVWAGCGSDDQGGGIGAADSGADSLGQSADAGSLQDSAGDSEAPGVVITYGKCEAFTKCGGDVVGVWKASGGCLSEETFVAARKNCPALKESDVVITAKGTMTITPTTLARNTKITLSGKLFLPKSCVPLPQATCATVAAGLMSPFAPGGLSFDKATCVDAPTDACNCEVFTELKEPAATDTYTTTPDGTLSAKGAAGDRTYDYCVAANKLTYTETTASQPLKLTVEIAREP
jgi:hypothetical protein